MISIRIIAEPEVTCSQMKLASLFRITCLLGSLAIFPSGVAGQVVRNQLPLVTRTSAVADRLYAGIIQDLNSANNDRAATDIERLRTQHAGMLVAIADRHQVEATLLADQLAKNSTRINTTRIDLTGSHFDTFAMWRAMLRGEIAPAELLALGDQYWQQGETQSAQQAWRVVKKHLSLTDSAPVRERQDPQQLTVELLKREIVSKLFTGKFRLAQKQLEHLQRTYPDVKGKVGGQDGNLYEILSHLLESLEYADREIFLQADQTLPRDSVRFDLLARSWSVPINCQSEHEQSWSPLIWNSILILQDESGVRALSLETGLPAWSTGKEDDGYLFTTQASETEDSVSTVCSEGVIHDHTWYGRTGVSAFAANRKLSAQQKSRISALNLEAEGRLDWTVTTAELSLLIHDTERIFSGAPVVKGKKLFVPLRSAAPGNQLQIACLNTENGSEVWMQDVAASLQSRNDGDISYRDRIIFEDNTLYWLIDGVALCCLGADNGILHWVSAMEPAFEDETQQTPSVSDLLIEADSILCTTINGIAAFDKLTGNLNWEQFLRQRPHSMIGVCDGVLIASSPGVFAVDCHTGKTIWSRVNNGPGSHMKRGSLQGRSLFLPTVAGLFTLDAVTGRVLQRDHFVNDSEASLEGVTLFGSTLMIQQRDQFVAYRVQRHLD